jgi:hypothetical protein
LVVVLGDEVGDGEHGVQLGRFDAPARVQRHDGSSVRATMNQNEMTASLAIFNESDAQNQAGTVTLP